MKKRKERIKNGVEGRGPSNFPKFFDEQKDSTGHRVYPPPPTHTIPFPNLPPIRLWKAQ